MITRHLARHIDGEGRRRVAGRSPRYETRDALRILGLRGRHRSQCGRARCCSNPWTPGAAFSDSPWGELPGPVPVGSQRRLSSTHRNAEFTPLFLRVVVDAQTAEEPPPGMPRRSDRCRAFRSVPRGCRLPSPGPLLTTPDRSCPCTAAQVTALQEVVRLLPTWGSPVRVRSRAPGFRSALGRLGRGRFR